MSQPAAVLGAAAAAAGVLAVAARAQEKQTRQTVAHHQNNHKPTESTQSSLPPSLPTSALSSVSVSDSPPSSPAYVQGGAGAGMWEFWDSLAKSKRKTEASKPTTTHAFHSAASRAVTHSPPERPSECPAVTHQAPPSGDVADADEAACSNVTVPDVKTFEDRTASLNVNLNVTKTSNSNSNRSKVLQKVAVNDWHFVNSVTNSINCKHSNWGTLTEDDQVDQKDQKLQRVQQQQKVLKEGSSASTQPELIQGHANKENECDLDNKAIIRRGSTARLVQQLSSQLVMGVLPGMPVGKSVKR